MAVVVGWTTSLIERLWRSLKHEDLYLKRLCRWPDAKAEIPSWSSKAIVSFIRRMQADGGWRERPQAAETVDMVDNADAFTRCPQ
ncbi:MULTISPECIES: hypothetical protein [unclassified Bradyrhizobium]|uniref:hypothetical protein n=1 Tax=unclassified Bradyrhizobium TaxID=2631580 RepID=UPI001FF7E240|nr:MULTISPECIES: hypothetical protein [unclassified Bradyrhizobium]MCK1609431.1 hypothetical protein [Bradyrhizobium sp. 163]MCK1764765.1 hypothetical protein [Bradyrhizobium sp. 136]